MSLMVPVRVSSALASALALEEAALDAAVDAAVEAAGAAVEAATEAAVEAEVDAVESADELPQPASTEAARTVDVASANNFFLIMCQFCVQRKSAGKSLRKSDCPDSRE